jgi:Uma2 family endonuclease
MVAMASVDHLHRFTTTEYDRMVDAGALEGLKVELLDGLLVDVTVQGPEHAAGILALQRLLATCIDLLRIQLPLACADGWTPEPDVALADNPGPTAHPSTAYLVAEVIVTAYAEARRKLPGYAAAGVPLVWLVDVPRRAVIELRDPVHDEFTSTRILSGDDLLDCAVSGVEPFTVATLFAEMGLAPLGL